MSKKKGKSTAKKPPKKKGPARKSPAKAKATAAPQRSPRTKTANIFIFKTEAGTRIRTSPQRLYANPGDHIEFNVVNMIDGSDVPVTIEFSGGGPWGKDPFQIRGWERKAMVSSPHGRFKYTVSALDAVEDPEVECPEN